MKFNIIGSIEDTPFEVRMFNTSSFIGIIMGFATASINMINEFPLQFRIVTWISALSFIVFYSLSRFKKLTAYLKLPYGVVILFTIINAWFYNEGIVGSMPYLLCYCCLAFPFIFNKSRYYMLALVNVIAVVLILIQVFKPQLMAPYPDYDSRFSDIAFTFVLVLIISSITLVLFMKNLDRERKIIENQNKKLEQQKEEITSQAEKLLLTNNKLMELDKFKEVMTSMVIHDLKNPLSSIIGLSNLKFSERNLQLIKQSGKQMLNLVMNILDVQKFENTQIRLNCEDNPLSGIINKSLGEISVMAEEKNLSVKITGQTENYVNVDEGLIVRVFINILSNAIKHSENNAQLIIHTDDVAENQFIKVSITDFGTGIKPEDLPNVFDKYTQIGAPKGGSARSTGLGLAFCKMVIESHDGKIGVVSIPGNHTTFWVTLKKSQSHEPADIHISGILAPEYDLHLNENEKEYLEQFVSQIKNLKHYESGKILPVLFSIEEHFSDPVERWKKEMENAVYTNNELKFNELVNISNEENPNC